MAKPFDKCKQDIAECLKHSKLSGLVPLVEQLSVSTEYSQHRWPTSDGTTLYLHHPNAIGHEWLMRLMTHYSCGCLDFWPHFILVSDDDEINTFVLESSRLDDPVCVHRRIAYDSDIISSVIFSIAQ